MKTMVFEQKVFLSSHYIIITSGLTFHILFTSLLKFWTIHI